jgi:ElaB/YqjD/DUF883 family membrane-anchored ribosome-binding protein
MTDDNTDGERILETVRADFEAGLDEAAEFAKRQWRENPLGVIAAAAGLGLIAGFLLGRRR